MHVLVVSLFVYTVIEMVLVICNSQGLWYYCVESSLLVYALLLTEDKLTDFTILVQSALFEFVVLLHLMELLQKLLREKRCISLISNVGDLDD